MEDSPPPPTVPRAGLRRLTALPTRGLFFHLLGERQEVVLETGNPRRSCKIAASGGESPQLLRASFSPTGHHRPQKQCNGEQVRAKTEARVVTDWHLIITRSASRPRACAGARGRVARNDDRARLRHAAQGSPG